MFIRRTTRKYKGEEFENYLLVESVRTAAGPRQKTIASLGDLRPRPREAWLELAHKVERSLAGEADLLAPPDPEAENVARRVRDRKPRRRGTTGANARPGKSDQSPDGVAPAASVKPSGELFDWADDPAVSVIPGAVRMERPREAGPVHAGHQYWNKLGMNEILESAGLDGDSVAVAEAMTLNRLIAPASENATLPWVERTALGDILGVDFGSMAEDRLYRNLDRLHPARELIESRLSSNERHLFNLTDTVFLYDLTSTYFEGAADENPQARRGYSRDKRPDCKQVVVGLVLGPDGFPRAHEVFEGNKTDGKSLDGMLDALNRRCPFRKGQTVVVDRGMAFDDNLKSIRDRGLHYIVASRQKERDQFLAELGDADGFVDVERRRDASHVRVRKLKAGDGHAIVLCHSAERVAKDRAIREKAEGRLLKDLKALEARVADGKLKAPGRIWEAVGRLRERHARVARYYDIKFDDKKSALAWSRDDGKLKVAEELDGTYIIKTDREDLSAEEAWRTYMLLTRVENAFRDMKSPLSERPIFHRLETRVQSHIFLCVLAYHLLNAIELTLRRSGESVSWETVKGELSTHQVATVVLPTTDGAVLRIRRDCSPEPRHLDLYRRLEIGRQVMEPRRSWTEAVGNEKRAAEKM